MFHILKTRLNQGYQTHPFPKVKPSLPDRFQGCPVIKPSQCIAGCETCLDTCPTEALSKPEEHLQLDLGRCLFCAKCITYCPVGAIAPSPEYRMAVRERSDLVLSGQELELGKALDTKLLRLLGRSLKLRQVSAGGCNGCESDVNVLNTIVFDLGRFGIQFVASPRHADGLLITGPVTKNMELALKETYEAIPTPKIVIAVGACAISGGPFIDFPAICQGANTVVPVDLYIPGCPPHPFTILDGLLRLLNKLEP